MDQRLTTPKRWRKRVLSVTTNAISLRQAIFDCFDRYAPGDGEGRGIESIAIDSDWVALIVNGHEVETRIVRLPTLERIRVMATSEEVRVVGKQLIDEGLLRTYNVSFANQGKNQKINPFPPSLFMLTPKGCLEILKRREERKTQDVR